MTRGVINYAHLYCIGQYYKPMMIVNDISKVITKLETSLTDDARVVIYDRHMFIVPATGVTYDHHLRSSHILTVQATGKV